jgi:hypothetical protein
MQLDARFFAGVLWKIPDLLQGIAKKAQGFGLPIDHEGVISEII